MAQSEPNKPRNATKVALYGVAAFVAVILGVALSVWIYGADDAREAMQGGESSGQAAIGGPFSSTDEDGAPRDQTMLEGRYSLVYFGFTHCPDFCPLELANLAAAKDLLEARGVTPQILFVTIDPARDTPEMLKAYVDYFDPDIIGLSGTAAQTEAMARRYRVFYQRVDDPDRPGEYTMDHTTIVYLMGPDGQYLTHFSAHTDPQIIAEAVLKAQPGA